MKVLIACEESQTICNEFRKLGHEAYSCDLYPCSGGHPEWHIQADCLPLLDGDCKFKTQDGIEHEIVGEFDLLIAHPPCTYLCITGQKWCSTEVPLGGGCYHLVKPESKNEMKQLSFS